MAYRSYINGHQVFGNNESYEEWFEFLKTQGISVNEEGGYEGEIHDVMEMFVVIDKITKNLIKKRHEEVLKGSKTFKDEPYKELTDFSGSFYLDDETPILLFNKDIIENAYCFMPYQALKAVEDKIIRVPGHKNRLIKDGVDWWQCTYRLKDGESIKVEAY